MTKLNTIQQKEPSLPKGLEYRGKGPGGEYYSKGNSLAAEIIWTDAGGGNEFWTADELEAIARHKRWLDAPKKEKPVTGRVQDKIDGRVFAFVQWGDNLFTVLNQDEVGVWPTSHDEVSFRQHFEVLTEDPAEAG